jgi:hypothetical protein
MATIRRVATTGGENQPGTASSIHRLAKKPCPSKKAVMVIGIVWGGWFNGENLCIRASSSVPAPRHENV